MVWSVCSFCLLANSVAADLVQSAVAVEGPPPVESFLWERTIDQSGLDLTFESGVTDYDSYVNSNPLHIRAPENIPITFAASFQKTPVVVTYDLGDQFNVTRLALWNYPFSTSGAFLEFDVTTANLADFSDSHFVGNFTAAADGDQITNALQDFDLIDSTARYVRITRITGLQAGSGLSEIAFGTSEIQCGAARGDVNLDGVIDLLDVGPFVDILINSQFQCEADIDADGEVTLLDVERSPI